MGDRYTFDLHSPRGLFDDFFAQLRDEDKRWMMPAYWRSHRTIVKLRIGYAARQHFKIKRLPRGGAVRITRKLARQIERWERERP